MPYNPIQGQGEGHGGLKCPKMSDFKGYLLRQYTVIRRLIVDYDTPRQYLHFNRTNV